MIKIKDLATRIQELLNEQSEFAFSIKTDTGRLKRSTRQGNSVVPYVNGLLSVISSDKSNLTDGSVFATLFCNLSFIVGIVNPNAEVETIDDLTITNTDKTVANLRAVIDTKFAENTQTTIEDSEGNSYLVIFTYQFASTGESGLTQTLGNSFTFNCTLGFMFVENGVSGYDKKYYLDGQIIPSQLVTDYRVATVDNNVYSDTKNGETKALASQSTFSTVIDLPALKNVVTETIFGNIFDGNINTAHLLTIEYPTLTGIKSKNMLVMFAETVDTAEGIKNVNNRITLYPIVEDYEIISISPKLKVYEVESVTANNEVVVIVRASNVPATIKAYCFRTKKFYSVNLKKLSDYWTISGLSVGDKLIFTEPFSAISQGSLTEIQ